MSGYYFHPLIKIVSVDGSIAVGKSTFCDILVKRLNVPDWKVLMVEEPVNIWRETGALDAFYRGDPQMPPALFQNHTFATRVGEFCDAYRCALGMLDSKECKGVILVTERSCWTDCHIFKKMLTDAGKITPMQSETYDKNFKGFMSAVWGRKPDLVLLLDINKDRVNESLRRIKQRGRLGEDNITADYQQLLFAAHDEVYGKGSFYGAPVVKVDTALDYLLPENANTLQKIIARITELL